MLSNCLVSQCDLYHNAVVVLCLTATYGAFLLDYLGSLSTSNLNVEIGGLRSVMFNV